MEPPPPQSSEQRNNHASSSSSSSPGMQSSHESVNRTPAGAGPMGKHRMVAAISFLNQQIQLIQDELDELDSTGGVSTICQEFVSNIDSVPDALLPVSRGPADVGWDRWFQGAQSSRNRRRWI
ncbi:hypothetical protein ABFX02_01G050000 [Erythranthe guttata]